MRNWPIYSLEQVANRARNAIVGGPFGSDLVSADYTETGVPVIRGENVSNGRWVTGPFARVSEDKADKLSANLARPGDIIFTQRGANHFRQIAVVPDGGEKRYLVSQSQMKMSVDREIADTLFVYYCFRDARQQEYLQTNAISTGVPHTNLGILKSVPLALPPLAEQRTIAATLGALDDKIELNRRTCATLEAMARALFRSWFVDFDPVHAKAAAETPAHMDPATAALFPDRFAEDGLPEGWRLQGLDEIAEFLNGLALQKYPAEPDGEALPVIKIAELRSGLSSKSGRASTALPAKYVVDDGDVLFSWSGSLMQKVWTEGRGALNQHLFKVSSCVVPKWFHFYAVDHHMEDFRAVAASKATTMGHIQRHHLKEAKIAVPPRKLLARLDRMAAPLFDRAISADLESRKLTALRDALLPKLMSGELRVREAERRVAEAV